MPKTPGVPVETLDVSGVAAEWDQCDDLRTRLRIGEPMMHPETRNVDVFGCRLNFSLLSPLVVRMACLDSKPLPPVEAMRTEIETLFVKNKRNSPEDVELIVKSAWRLKKLCGFVKMKTRRQEVSTVSRCIYTYEFSICVCMFAGLSNVFMGILVLRDLLSEISG